jgi:hypothetical protein
MKIKHNKKRNVGLVFEQLSRKLTSSTLQGDKETAKKCAKIIAEHFSKGTALYDEMRLFRSLSNTTIKNDALIMKILGEARAASSVLDAKALSKEKTALIKRLNEEFGKGAIFNTPVDNYKTLASIQVLLNEWRRSSNCIDEKSIATLEDQLITEIKGSKSDKRVDESEAALASSSTPSFVVELAKKKFFKKYRSLSKAQTKMLFEMTTCSREDCLQKAKSTAASTTKNIENYMTKQGKKQSKYFISTLREAAAKIKQSDFDSMEKDELTVKAVAMKKLEEELTHE